MAVKVPLRIYRSEYQTLDVDVMHTCPCPVQLFMDGGLVNLQIHVLDSWHILFQKLLPFC